jgi:hypothetical protein
MSFDWIWTTELTLRQSSRVTSVSVLPHKDIAYGSSSSPIAQIYFNPLPREAWEYVWNQRTVVTSLHQTRISIATAHPGGPAHF